MSDEKKTLLKVEGLTMKFGPRGRQNTVIHNVSFEIGEGETFGLVGESGSGKSTIGRCIIGLYKPCGGSIRFQGEILEPGEMRREIQMIFQDPMASLNPRKKVGDIVGAGLDIHKLYKSREERDELIGSILERVGLSRDQANRYPAQFSGGQRQRVGIARALIMNPRLIIADECIAALDASIQAQIVNLIRNIQRETGTSFLFISHDLSMVRYLSDRIGVLHRGFLLETGKPDELFGHPVHPYTRNLLSSIPSPNPIVQLHPEEHYDYETSGIVYENGTWHTVGESSSHQVLCTDDEYVKWGAGK